MAAPLAPGSEQGMQRTLLDLPDALLASADDVSALNHFAIQHLLCATDVGHWDVDARTSKVALGLHAPVTGDGETRTNWWDSAQPLERPVPLYDPSEVHKRGKTKGGVDSEDKPTTSNSASRLAADQDGRATYVTSIEHRD
eukprot:1178005-Prorocentrum_minimum.AAC.5